MVFFSDSRDIGAYTNVFVKKGAGGRFDFYVPLDPL